MTPISREVLAVKREELLNIIDAACLVQRWDYAREVAQVLLDVWPNDLAAQCGMARAVAHERLDEAIDRLRRVVAVDGQDADALALLSRLLVEQGYPKEAELAAAAAMAVRPDDPALQVDLQRWPAWLYPALRARRALEVGNAGAAFHALRPLIDARDQDELAAHPAPWLTLLEAAWRAGRWAELRAIAARVRSRWPGAALPDLLLGAALMRDGQHEQGVALLHNAVARDPAGQTPARVWGAGHPYRSLWPEAPSLALPALLPADVAAALGRSRLGAGADYALPARAGQEPGDASAPATSAPTTGASPHPAQTAQPVAGIETGLDREIRPRLRALESQPKSGDAPVRAAPARTARLRLLSQKPAARPSPPRPAELPPAGAGEEKTPQPPVEDGRAVLEAFQSDLATLVEKVAGPKGLPADAPTHEVHLIVTHYGAHEARYGAEAARQIEKLLDRLARATEVDTGLLTDVIFVDRADSLRSYGLEPVAQPTPDAVKALLAALDAKLAEDRAIIASALIVGDDGVIPCFRLPNPVEDSDAEILTDAPYASRGDSALVGERAVGRLPQADLEGLTQAIKNAIHAHRRQSQPGATSFWRALLRRLLRRPLMPTSSLGCTASVWRDAAEDVYSVIGRTDSLRASPPTTAADWRPEGLNVSGYGYFNLHGLDDAPCWYGQRDPSESIYPDFPIALSPDDVVNSGRAPRVVFSAACYGASVNGKSPRESMALRFLECGTLGFIGSTVISYGSVERPLVGADLLARRFWERLASGYAQGFALRDAKRQFADEMQNRQGYLDTEDHKTLISFVLYGDPTVRPEPAKRKPRAKGLAGQTPLAAMPDFTLAGPPEPASVDVVPNETVQRVKTLAARFLPGVHEAELSFARPRVVAPRPTPRHGKTLPTPSAILTLRKAHQIDEAHCWQQIARVAVTDTGHVVKVTVSK